MLGIQLQVGERKHAIRDRRLQEEDIMTTCPLHLTYLADVGPDGGEHFLMKLRHGQGKNVQGTP